MTSNKIRTTLLQANEAGDLKLLHISQLGSAKIQYEASKMKQTVLMNVVLH